MDAYQNLKSHIPGINQIEVEIDTDIDDEEESIDSQSVNQDGPSSIISTTTTTQSIESEMILLPTFDVQQFPESQRIFLAEIMRARQLTGKYFFFPSVRIY